MTWEEVCADPSLRNLPYKIELNEWNKIEMSPAGNRRKEYQLEIARLLQELRPEGRAIVEPAVRTSENVKVPDVVWISASKDKDEAARLLSGSIAPEICVELITPRNVWEEKMHKRQLYLQAGAKEFWLCDEQGSMHFFDVERSMKSSILCPNFPLRVVTLG